MKNINTIFTFTNGVPNSLTAIVDGNQYSVDSTHANWNTILDDVRNDDAESFVKHVDIRKAFEDYTVGNVKIVGGEVYYGNTRLGGPVVDRIFDFMTNNLPVDPLLRFVNKLFSNPSARAVNELYNFLQHKNMPITDEGNFWAYKGLQSDFYSITSGKLTLLQGTANKEGKIYNGVGETIECVRHQVNDNKDETCSYGLHAGSLEYARDFAQGKLVIVEINPADVVSIPSDCDGQKLRTCKYKVVQEYVEPLNSVYVKTNNFNNNSVSVEDIETDGTLDDVDDVDETTDSEDELTEEDSWDRGWEAGVAAYNAGEAYDDVAPEDETNPEEYSEAYYDGFYSK
jgi:hypothetical protein